MKLGITSSAAGYFSGRESSENDVLTRGSGIRKKVDVAEPVAPEGGSLERDSGVQETGSQTYLGTMRRLIDKKRTTLSRERDALQTRLEKLVNFNSAIEKVKNVTQTVVDTTPETDAYRAVRDQLVQINGQLEILRLKEREVALENEDDPEVRARQAKELIALQGKMLELEGQYGMLDLHEDVPFEAIQSEDEVRAIPNPFDQAA